MFVAYSLVIFWRLFHWNEEGVRRGPSYAAVNARLFDWRRRQRHSPGDSQTYLQICYNALIMYTFYEMLV